MNLPDLLAQLEQAETPVYLGAEGSLSGHEMAVKAARLGQFFITRPEQIWGLHCLDTATFAPALLGLLAAGKQVRLLPHVQPGLLQEVQHDLDAFVLDEPVEGLQKPVITNQPSPGDGAVADNFPCDEMGSLAFYTSGSTGESKMFHKDLEQLLAEVEVLDALWGNLAPEMGMCATVSHQHIYGFLFKFLWPLVTGRPVWSPACFYPAEIEEAVKELGRGVLISTPSHLKRLPELMDWSALEGRCCGVFSSGGPLALEPALAIRDHLGQAPYEVFGSTETGGVAWRQQTNAGVMAPWTPFSPVQVQVDAATECLQVTSPFIHPSELRAGIYTMQDRVEIGTEGQFVLKGRVDRIVKVEQKRVSLEQMEQRLVELDEVEEASVIVLDDGSGSQRSRLGAAVVPAATVKNENPSELKDRLKQALTAWFEPTVLPRSWVLVDALPVNAQGKKPLAELRALFERTQEQVVRPRVLSKEQEGPSVTLQCEVPENLLYFDGHFDTLPVVAGVVQVHWAMDFAEEFFGVTREAHQLEAIKFHQLLFPRDRFTLSLSYAAETQKIQFSLFQDEKKFSSGRVAIGAA